MFDLGFTKDDLKRVAWTLVQAALAVVITAGAGWIQGEAIDINAVYVGIVAAVIAAIKNFLLSDGSALK